MRASVKRKQYKMLERLQRLMEQRHLYSIRTAFITIMPIMIVGAFATAINQMPIPAYQNFMLSLFGEQWRTFGALCFNATTQVAAVVVVFFIGSNLAIWHNAHLRKQVHEGICGMVAFASYVIVSLDIDGPNNLPFTITGVTGLFVGLVISCLASELFIAFSSRSTKRHLLSEDPNRAVPLAFSAVIPCIITLGLFALLRVVLLAFGVQEGLSTIVYGLLRMPYTSGGNTFATAQLFNVSTHTMWLFGIHGNNVLDQVAQDIFVPAAAENFAAVAMGLPAPNLITKTFFDAFVYMGGSGGTLSLLLALFLFGRANSYRTLFRFALPTSLLNINEPLIFGVPIVLNPLYALPFLLTPLITLSTSALAMQMGWVPYTIREVSWATPVLYSGYIATGSFAGTFLQIFNLGLGMLIYAPFVKLSERLLSMRFDTAYEQLCTIITTEYSASSRKLVARTDEVGSVARRLANHLQAAIRNHELYLVYQPIVDANDNTLHSVESLLRWKHSQHGNITPLLTIALAEEIHLIDELGLWILEESLRQRAEWVKQGLDDFHVSVNISPLQLEVPQFATQVAALLQKYRVPAALLQIEVTETVALGEGDATTHNLEQLNRMGVTLAMDDFGVGHSSLLYLRTQAFSTLKIDASLSRDVIKHPANLEIISTIHDLCRAMSVSMIIEYVETAEQLRLLKSVGGHLIQGYFFSPPMAGGDLPSWLQDLALTEIVL